jgi:hypothetical protein
MVSAEAHRAAEIHGQSNAQRKAGSYRRGKAVGMCSAVRCRIRCSSEHLFSILRNHAIVLGEDLHILHLDEHLGAFLQL